MQFISHEEISKREKRKVDVIQSLSFRLHDEIYEKENSNYFNRNSFLASTKLCLLNVVLLVGDTMKFTHKLAMAQN